MNKSNQDLRGWVLVIGILVIVALTGGLAVYALWQSAKAVQQTIQPVNEMTSNLSTQVAQVLNPTPTILPDPVTVIYQVRSLARLETIQYSVEKVITAETGQEVVGELFGDRILFVAHGIVQAGVDLEKLEPGDMWLDGGVLYFRLPEAEIFIVTLDNQKSYVYDRDTGLLTHGDVNLETAARQAAEVEIRKAALEDGILPQAAYNAENFLARLLRDLGYPDVIFIKPTPTP
jgi:hypothetical protein